MKRLSCVLIVLAVTATGCRAREATWSFHTTSGPGADHVLFLVGRTAAASDDPVELGFDDEFDELEQKLVVEMVEVADPLEGWNRVVFQFNDALYFWVAKPVLEAYVKLTPEEVRNGLRNFFHNLGMPARAINCLLQGNWEGAGIEVRRFGINTTVGILGVLDVARTEFRLEPVEADMGQTLAVYGIGDGCYLIWPVLGPSTVRDSVGLAADQFMNPVRYVRPVAVSVGVSAFDGVNDGSFHLGEYESLKSDALDPYVALRQAYVQYRSKKVKGALE